MEGLVADTLDAAISRADKEVLVNTVRLIQKQNLRGSKGGWKEFLNSYDRQLGASLSNPSKRSQEVLRAFLKTFNESSDFMIVGKILRHHGDHKAMENNLKDLQDEESPQQRLVRLTREHPLYAYHYYFRTHEKNWKVVPIGDISSAMKSTTMVAVDCEMVLCEHGTNEVVKICIVDHKMKVKLENLVKPSKSIVDYRTEITGISAEDLVGVTYTLVEAQKSVRKLLRNGTFLVGHSLHNDLRALKIEYQRVIDTAYIFKYSDLPPDKTPSLNSLCKAVLGYAVRHDGEPHDCRKDAEAAMKLVIAKLKHGFDHPIKVVCKNVSYFERAKLLLHNVPIEIPSKELQKVFPRDLSVDIQADGRVQGPFYSTVAVFKDAREADKAFQYIGGQHSKDSTGRLQKRVTMRLSTGKLIRFFIRKMMSPSPLKNDGLSVKKRSTSCEENGSLKKPRSCSSTEALESRVNAENAELEGGCSSETCEHVGEIERLKQILRTKEDEIFNLQKILAALSRKHGL